MKKIFTTMMASMLLLSCTLTACKAPESSVDTAEHLEIKIYNAGYGTQNVKDVAARFMELNPGKTVSFVENTDPLIMQSEIKRGPSLNTVDLYFAGGDFMPLVAEGSFTVEGKTYDSMFASLDDVYESAPTGETTLIKNKMVKEFASYYYEEQETSYFAPWVMDWGGIVYNSKMFENYGWEVPVTTDELIELCGDIVAFTAKSTNKNSMGQDIKISPFIYSREDSYWYGVYEEWYIQYEGLEGFKLFKQGKNAAGEYTPDIKAAPGILKSMELMDTLVGTCYNDNGTVKSKPADQIYCDNLLTFRTYTDTQATFLYGEEARINQTGATTAAMIPCGGWIENEMKTNFSEEIASGKVAFKCMKTPIISAITDKTSFKGDENLSTLVKWIDGGKQGAKPAFATDADVKIVEDARNVVQVSNNYVCAIPAYSTSVDLAKEFIKFMYSDEGCRIFTAATKGVDLPIRCDLTGVQISEFQKSKFAITSNPNVTPVMIYRTYPVALASNEKVFHGALGQMESKFAVSNVNDYVSPAELFVANYNDLKNRWQGIMSDAGLN